MTFANYVFLSSVGVVGDAYSVGSIKKPTLLGPLKNANINHWTVPWLRLVFPRNDIVRNISSEILLYIFINIVP
jgi:hypothetical protein